MSTYVPPWIKRDNKRFPRAKIEDGLGGSKIAEVLSVFSEENAETDAHAFAGLMKHLKQLDGDHGTVIMVQVENEVGLLGATRDLAGPAQAVYEQVVPRSLLVDLCDRWDDLHPVLRTVLDKQRLSTGSNGTWSEVFGSSKQADEIFMAYHYALYVEKVAARGRTEYALPLFTNAWLSSFAKDPDARVPVMAGGGEDPGDWPCGGPNIGVLDIWMSFAPTLDFFSPDVYIHDYSEVLRHWKHRDQPLFIPEQRRDPVGLRWMWEAFGTYGALAASPFGIDSLEGNDRVVVREHFGLLAQLQSFILQSQASPGSCYGFWFDDIKPGETILGHTKTVQLGGYELTIKRAFVPGKLEPAYGLICPLSENKFLFAGAGYQVWFRSIKPESLFTGIISFDEQIVLDQSTGARRTLRRYNGDEIVGGKCVVMPSLKPDASSFPIAIFIPAGARIAEVEVYDLWEE